MGTCRELTTTEYRAIARALNVLQGVLREPGVALSSPRRVVEYLQLKIGALEHEVFAVLLLCAATIILAGRRQLSWPVGAAAGCAVGDGF